MNHWATSLRLFVVRAWFIGVLAVGLVVNPVRLAQYFGWLPTSYALAIPPLAYRTFFASLLLLALFVWFHRQRIAFEVARAGHPTVMFTDMLRYIATSSRWAAKDTGDDDWVRRLERAVLDDMALGRLTAFGRKYSPNTDREFTLSLIPAEFWRTASLYAFDVMNERSTQQTVHSTKPNGPAYTEIYFDREQVRRVWPPRSWVAAVLRQSPAERRGNVGDWRERDSKLTAQELEIRDGLARRLHERDARAADRSGQM
jgi:hypothetical protein